MKNTFYVQDGLGAYGQTKQSSQMHVVPGRLLLAAGFPKQHLRSAVKEAVDMKKRGCGSSRPHLLCGPQGVMRGTRFEVQGKTIWGSNGLDIYYCTSAL